MTVLKSLFAEFAFDCDDDDTQLLFQLPFVPGVFGFTNLSFVFWIETFVLFTIQSVLNMFVALFVDKFIIRAKHREHRSYLIGYGFVIPVLLFAPFYLVDWLKLGNVTLMVTLAGALPNLLVLRVIEAMHDTLPSFAKESTKNFVLYCSATLQVMIDEKTQKPVPFTRRIFYEKTQRFVTVLLQTSFLYSVLLPFGYTIAPTRRIGHFLDLFYWGNLANNFIMASLTSLLLEGGASGLGLLTSICTGVTLQTFSDYPLTKSSSPSDFWSNRWDRPVASGLKNGTFRPLRQAGWNRHTAAILTFLVSGLIHEYMLLFMSIRHGRCHNNPQQEQYQPGFGTHFLFFAWNGIVLLIQRVVEDNPIIEQIASLLPKPVRTFLVLLTVLPISWLFTDEYINSCFFSDSAFAFPRITYLGEVQ